MRGKFISKLEITYDKDNGTIIITPITNNIKLSNIGEEKNGSYVISSVDASSSSSSSSKSGCYISENGGIALNFSNTGDRKIFIGAISEGLDQNPFDSIISNTGDTGSELHFDKAIFSPDRPTLNQDTISFLHEFKKYYSNGAIDAKTFYGSASDAKNIGTKAANAGIPIVNVDKSHDRFLEHSSQLSNLQYTNIGIAILTEQAKSAIQIKDFKTYDVSALPIETALSVDYSEILLELRNAENEVLAEKFAKTVAPNNRTLQQDIIKQINNPDIEIDKINTYIKKEISIERMLAKYKSTDVIEIKGNEWSYVVDQEHIDQLVKYAVDNKKPVVFVGVRIDDFEEELAQHAVNTENFGTYDSSKLSDDQQKRFDPSKIKEKLKKIKDLDEKRKLCKKFVKEAYPDDIKLQQETLQDLGIEQLQITLKDNKITIKPGHIFKGCDIGTSKTHKETDDSIHDTPYVIEKEVNGKQGWYEENGQIKLNFSSTNQRDLFIEKIAQEIEGYNDILFNSVITDKSLFGYGSESTVLTKQRLNFNPEFFSPSKTSLSSDAISFINSIAHSYDGGAVDLSKDSQSTINCDMLVEAAKKGIAIINVTDSYKNDFLTKQAEAAIENNDFKTYDVSNLQKQKAEFVDYSKIVSELRKGGSQQLCQNFAKTVAPNDKPKLPTDVGIMFNV